MDWLEARSWQLGAYFVCSFPNALISTSDAGRKIELHQRVDGLRRRLEDVDEPLVRANLELLRATSCRRAASRSTVHCLSRSEAESARQPRPGALGRVDDLGRRLIEHARSRTPSADSNLVAEHCHF
jgi:hypothetical protein